MNQLPKKSLGQHWLKDEQALESICDTAELYPNDVVLEIGPGQGALTKYLVERAKQVIAIELDNNLANSLKNKITAENLTVINQDILKFDFSQLPNGYKIVANIPYYLTSHLFRVLSETSNPPASAVILVQKEVAERICAGPGQMSILSVSVQLYFETSLGLVIPAESFEPPPKIDSQLVVLKWRTQPLFKNVNEKEFFKVVKAGFSARRKKLRSSLSGGLAMNKTATDQFLSEADVNGELRAQNLSLKDWYKLYTTYAKLEHK